MKLTKITIKTKYGYIGLTCYESYVKRTKEELKKICNGLGPKGFGAVIPDTLFFLNVTPAGNIHDECYEVGGHIYNKEQADRIFRDNMFRLIEQKPKQWKWIKKLRYKKAYMYYLAVVKGGGVSFKWRNK